MAEKFKYIVVEEQTRVERLPDGNFAAHLDWMDLTAVADSVDHARQKLDSALKRLLEDPAAQDRWRAYVQEHGDEMDLDAPEEPWEPSTEQKTSMKKIPEISLKEWESVTSGEVPVLVNFSAEWCKPCYWMAPALVEVAEEWKERLQVVKVDADKERGLVESLRIESLPTILLIKDGAEVGRISGPKPRHKLTGWFEPLL